MTARFMRFIAGAVAAAVLTVGCAVPASAASKVTTKVTTKAAGARAMWLWNEAPADQVVAWAQQNGVTSIFVNFTRNSNLAGLKLLKKRADAARIRLDALGGDASWAFDHAAALNWSRSADATGLFAGRHVDVEPYLLPEWTSNRTRTATSYLALLDKLKVGTPLEIDVPFWYGQFTVNGANLASEVVRRVSSVTVMSYRDKATGPNSIMDVATDMLTRTSRAGVKTRLAVETQPLAECVYCTFAQEGRAAMTATLKSVDGGAATFSSYAGVAVHHYTSWRTLRN